jgi:hypothetical protein
MSVDVEPPMLAAGLAPTHYAFLAGKGVVRITARKARELGMRVGPEPVKGNPHHGGHLGAKSRNQRKPASQA